MKSFKEEILELYVTERVRKNAKAYVSIECEQDIVNNYKSFGQDKTGPITKKEVKEWTKSYNLIKDLNVDNIYNKVQFYDDNWFREGDEKQIYYTKTLQKPMHERPEEIYNEEDNWFR